MSSAMQSGRDQSASSSEQLATTEPTSSHVCSITPMIAKSQQAFYRDLPELRKYRDGWWIAYRGDERLGFARKQIDLYEECFRRGLTDDQFVVRHALPLLGQRGLWCAELQSWIDHRRCRVTIRTRRKFWPFC